MTRRILRRALRAQVAQHGLDATLSVLTDIATTSPAAPLLRAYTRDHGLAASVELFVALVEPPSSCEAAS